MPYLMAHTFERNYHPFEYWGLLLAQLHNTTTDVQCMFKRSIRLQYVSQTFTPAFVYLHVSGLMRTRRCLEANYLPNTQVNLCHLVDALIQSEFVTRTVLRESPGVEFVCLKAGCTIVVVLFIIKKWSRERIYTDEHKRAPATESNRLMKRRKIQQRREKTTSLDTELKTLNTQDKAGFF